MNETLPMVTALMPQRGEASGYDVIGDIHGCAHSLARLLEQMGYKKMAGVYQHPSRQVIFLGDVLDRGPRIREALHLVRSMVDSGNALMVLGNHEFNAITYSTPVSPNSHDYLRPHTAGNSRQVAETLAQFSQYPDEWQDFVNWFVSLPLFLEIQHPHTGNLFRAVHACWDHALIQQHCSRYGDGRIDWAFVIESAQKNSLSAITKQRLTGGVDIALPEGVKITSEDGYSRTAFRTKFWANQARTYGELLFQPDPLPDSIACAEISAEHRARMVYYDVLQPPLFIGHYWMKGHPEPLTPNLACLDYSAVKFGKLVAYRMDGEAQLSPDKFVWVYVDP